MSETTERVEHWPEVVLTEGEVFRLTGRFGSEPTGAQTYFPASQLDTIRQAASNFLDASVRINRSGDQQSMEEYEECWHELRTILTQQGERS